MIEKKFPDFDPKEFTDSEVESFFKELDNRFMIKAVTDMDSSCLTYTRPVDDPIEFLNNDTYVGFALFYMRYGAKLMSELLLDHLN